MPLPCSQAIILQEGMVMNPIVMDAVNAFDISIYEPIIPRRLSLGKILEPKAGNLMKVVTGMRRSGKSYRLFQEMRRLHDNGIPWNRICYFNFEDDRLSPVTPEVGDEVLEAFETINPGSFDQGVFLFFDELQEMENWGKWLRRIVDTRRVTIYATGSSSKMLSSEITTAFRGRAIDFELLPLSFSESITFNGLSIPGQRKPAFTERERLGLQRALHDYLKTGGFPAAQGLPDQERVPLLQSYAQQVVSRDVVERHSLAKPRVASMFAQKLLGSNARQLSIRKTENELRSIGVATSRESLGDMLEYFEQAYLAFVMKSRTYHLAEPTNSIPKVYAIDPGLAAANSKAYTNDAGQRLEDAVYLELRRRSASNRNEAITSLRTKGHSYEVDFAVGDALLGNDLSLYQVCVDANDAKTLDRELRALWEAMAEHDAKEATLIVADGTSETYERNGFVVNQVPAWLWLLPDTKSDEL